MQGVVRIDHPHRWTGSIYWSIGFRPFDFAVRSHSGSAGRQILPSSQNIIQEVDVFRFRISPMWSSSRACHPPRVYQPNAITRCIFRWSEITRTQSASITTEAISIRRIGKSRFLFRILPRQEPSDSPTISLLSLKLRLQGLLTQSIEAYTTKESLMRGG